MGGSESKVEIVTRKETAMQDFASVAETLQQLIIDAAVWIMRTPCASSRTRRPLANLNIDSLVRRVTSMAMHSEELLRSYPNSYPHVALIDHALDTIYVIIVGKYDIASYEPPRFSGRWARTEGVVGRQRVIDLLETCLKCAAVVTEMSEPEFNQMRDMNDTHSWVNMALMQLDGIEKYDSNDPFDVILIGALLETIHALIDEINAFDFSKVLQPAPSVTSPQQPPIRRAQSAVNMGPAAHSASTPGRSVGSSFKVIDVRGLSRRSQSEATLTNQGSKSLLPCATTARGEDKS